MADYCALSDVYPLISKIGTLRDAATGPPVVTATVPSAAQAGLICTQVSSEINMHLRVHGYTVPVTDADALAALKAVAMNGSAYRILKSAFPAAAGVSGDGGAYESLRADYLAGLALIDAGGLAADMAADDASDSVSYDFTRTYDVLSSALNADTNVEPF
jgi:hypothetical protein